MRNLNNLNSKIYNNFKNTKFSPNLHKKKYFRNSQNNSIKLNFCAPYFWKKTFLFKQSIVFRMGDKKIYNRSSAIPFSFKNLKVKIYSGKKWFSRLITIWSVGFKFGELTWNRRLALYKAKQLKKKKKK